MEFLPIHTISEIREIENFIFQSGTRADDLMRLAGKQAYDIIRESYPDLKSLTIFCGKGNNAGDGYVIAKHALDDDLKVRLIELCENSSEVALEVYKGIAGNIVKEKFSEQLEISEDDLIIDAIFGIGLTGIVQEDAKSAIDFINNLPNQVVAIDCPSGLNADTGEIANVAIRANLTISFISAKFGLYICDGKDCCGEIRVADLDISAEALNEFSNHYKKISTKSYKDLLPARLENSNKGSFGSVALVGGFADMPGAILLSAESCMRVGAGRTTVVTERKNFGAILKALPEAVLADVAELPKDFFDGFDVIAIGPGLGTSDEASDLLRSIQDVSAAKVIDADALNIVAENQDLKFANAIITPHPKEAARLLGKTLVEVQKDRGTSLMALSKIFQATAVLKGHCSLVKHYVSPEIYFCPYGNSGLAKAGSGDVLTGIIAGLLAQGESLLDAAVKGVVIHAKCADHLVLTQERNSLIPSDLIKALK